MIEKSVVINIERVLSEFVRLIYHLPAMGTW